MHIEIRSFNDVDINDAEIHTFEKLEKTWKKVQSKYL